MDITRYTLPSIFDRIVRRRQEGSFTQSEALTILHFLNTMLPREDRFAGINAGLPPDLIRIRAGRKETRKSRKEREKAPEDAIAQAQEVQAHRVDLSPKTIDDLLLQILEEVRASEDSPGS